MVRTATQPNDLYDADILTWAERQAALLRRMAAGEPVNDALDWNNVIEEIESVGRSELGVIQSLLTLALLHDLKAEVWPLALDVERWRADARLFRRQARRKYRPSMRDRIDLAGLYADALAGLPANMDRIETRPLPPVCPVLLETLLGEA